LGERSGCAGEEVRKINGFRLGELGETFHSDQVNGSGSEKCEVAGAVRGSHFAPGAGCAGADLYVVDGAAVFLPGMIQHVESQGSGSGLAPGDGHLERGQGEDVPGGDCQISSGMRGRFAGDLNKGVGV